MTAIILGHNVWSQRGLERETKREGEPEAANALQMAR
jgi:hypothetical protein